MVLSIFLGVGVLVAILYFAGKGGSVIDKVTKTKEEKQLDLQKQKDDVLEQKRKDARYNSGGIFGFLGDQLFGEKAVDEIANSNKSVKTTTDAKDKEAVTPAKVKLVTVGTKTYTEEQYKIAQAHKQLKQNGKQGRTMIGVGK